jgi:nitrate reductase gamma subunit
MIGIIIIALIFFVIFIAPNWMDSDNEIKQNIGCTSAIIVVLFGALISLLGTCKGCADRSPSHEYYESPRK